MTFDLYIVLIDTQQSSYQHFYIYEWSEFTPTFIMKLCCKTNDAGYRRITSCEQTQAIANIIKFLRTQKTYENFPKRV